MNYVVLLQESPALFLLILVISLVITLFVYGVFPVVFAKLRKTPIAKKKYKRLCYGMNSIGLLFFIVLNGAVSGAPYLLWTWVFSNYGVKTLEAKGLFDDELENDGTSLSDSDKICFCRKCGATLEEGSRFCRKCGTEIKEEQQ